MAPNVIKFLYHAIMLYRYEENMSGEMKSDNPEREKIELLKRDLKENEHENL